MIPAREEKKRKKERRGNRGKRQEERVRRRLGVSKGSHFLSYGLLILAQKMKQKLTS